MTPSIRQRILAALAKQVSGIEKGDEVPFVFSIVKVGRMPDSIQNKRSAIGIVPGTERKSPLFPETDCILPLEVEFRFSVQSLDGPELGGGDPSMAAEIALLVAQRAILLDRTLGGLCLDIVETGNQIDLDAFSDKTVAGVIMAEVQYRHDEGDPANWLRAPPP